MEVIEAAESAPARTAARRRRSSGGGRQCAGETRNGWKGGRTVEDGDAERAADAAEGQIHDVRPEGKEVSEGRA